MRTVRTVHFKLLFSTFRGNTYFAVVVILSSRGTLDKVTGSICPACHQPSLSVFYEEQADQELGRKCDACGFRGMYLGGRLVVMAV